MNSRSKIRVVTTKTPVPYGNYSRIAEIEAWGSTSSGEKTYYAWGGSSVLAEYKETSSQTNMPWSKHYVYAGSRLLSTAAKNGSSEKLEYHHPDKLGTKMVSDPVAANNQEQAALPFGTKITAETQAATNQRFTSYDRSDATGLDYAVNRAYNSGQGRFTTVDPIGMGDASLGNPQSMNLYGYVRNNPIDFVDPNGMNLQSPTYYLDGIQVTAAMAHQVLGAGAAVIVPGGQTNCKMGPRCKLRRGRVCFLQSLCKWRISLC